MSQEIIDHYLDKKVRTELQFDQRDSQPWPAITICSKASLNRHFRCYKNIDWVDLGAPDLCSKQIKRPIVSEDVENLEFDFKEGCMVYNLNGTLTHKGKLKKGLDINYFDPNIDNEMGIIVFFYDVKTVFNA